MAKGKGKKRGVDRAPKDVAASQQQEESQDGMTTAAEESQDTLFTETQNSSIGSGIFEDTEEGHDKESGEAEEDGEEDDGEEDSQSREKAKDKKTDTRKTKVKQKKKAAVEICTERDFLERVPLPKEESENGAGSSGEAKTFTVLSWNVNGLRATVKNGLDVLRRMVETERPDLVCFQVQQS